MYEDTGQKRIYPFTGKKTVPTAVRTKLEPRHEKQGKTMVEAHTDPRTATRGKNMYHGSRAKNGSDGRTDETGLAP